MITSIGGSIHHGHGAFSEHSRGQQCAFISFAALLFNLLQVRCFKVVGSLLSSQNAGMPKTQPEYFT